MTEIEEKLSTIFMDIVRPTCPNVTSKNIVVTEYKERMRDLLEGISYGTGSSSDVKTRIIFKEINLTNDFLHTLSGHLKRSIGINVISDFLNDPPYLEFNSYPGPLLRQINTQLKKDPSFLKLEK